MAFDINAYTGGAGFDIVIGQPARGHLSRAHPPDTTNPSSHAAKAQPADTTNPSSHARKTP